MKIIETIALITINETLYFQLISFFVFLFILNRIMIRPLRKVMGERSMLLDRLSEEVTTTQQSFHDIEHQIEIQENAARVEAFKTRNKIEAEGQHEAEDLIAKTKGDIDALKSKAHKEADDHLAVARQEIEKEAAMISEQMIFALLGRRSGS